MVQLVDAPFLQGATLLAAESAGFFLAKAIARTNSLDTAIAKIDQRRLPTTELRSGPIGRKVVVVTDVVTTGSSVETLISLAQQNDATVSGVLTFGMLDPAAFTRLLSKHRLEGQWLVQASNWSTWDRSECPMCASDANDIVPAFELN
jgi:orotate phosphoribosyltransferase